MARRMFSPDIVNSDAFLEMPPSTQALYFQLGMKADDDGFVNPKMVMRMIGSSDDELKVLVGKRFVLPFENGVIVIKHWRVNNLIRKDWYRPTQYLEQKSLLSLKENGSYTFDSKQGVPLLNGVVNESLTNRQHSIGKDRIGKDSLDNTDTTPTEKKVKVKKENKKFVKPTVQEIEAYCLERKNGISAVRFFNYYESKGWVVGKSPMKNWKSAVHTWENSEFNKKPKTDTAKYDKYKT